MHRLPQGFSDPLSAPVRAATDSEWRLIQIASAIHGAGFVRERVPAPKSSPLHAWAFLVTNHSNCQASMLRRPLSFALPARRLVPEMSKLRTFYLSASVYLHASCVCTYVNVYIRTYIHMYLLTHLPTSTYPATHIHK